MQTADIWAWLDDLPDCFEHLDLWDDPPFPSLPKPATVASHAMPLGQDAYTRPRGSRKKSTGPRSLPENQASPAKILLRNNTVGSVLEPPKLANKDEPAQLPRSDTYRRQLQASGREGNKEAVNYKRLPTSWERTRNPAYAAAWPHSTNLRDPAGINCEGARVVAGYK